MKVAIGLLIAIIVALCIAVVKLRQQANTTIQRNTAVEQENQQLEAWRQSLEADCDALNDEYEQLYERREEELRQLESIRERISVQNNVLKSLTSSSENVRRSAEEQAQSVYEAKVAALNKEYDEKKQQLDEKMQQESLLLLKKIEEEQEKLSDIENKQLAYVQAQQRAEQIEAQKDYYRLVLEEGDEEDVKLLRNIQAQMRKKDAIDKVIYETYYRPSYDVLMSHIFDGTTKICGIYKITNLENGQAYIGQSVDMRERFRQHIKAALTVGPSTNKLYQQMKKYGPENFTFEVLEIVDRAKLNEREVYWIDFYKTKEFGMNGTKGGA